jgi:hypothetical protein
MKVYSDGTCEIQVETLLLPPANEVMDSEPSRFTSIDGVLQDVETPKKFRVANAIMGKLTIDGRNYGLQFVESTRAGEKWVKEGRLGVAAIQNDGQFDQVWLTQTAGTTLAMYCLLQPGIAVAIAEQKRVTKEHIFRGEADDLFSWVQENASPCLPEHPLVRETLSAEGIKEIGRLAHQEHQTTTEMLEGVSTAELIRESDKAAQEIEFELGQRCLCTETPWFGSAGYLVGFSIVSKTAAFVLTKEAPGSTTFGGFLEQPLGIVTTLNCLIPMASEPS